MSVDLEIDGPYQNLEIVWWTCWRKDGSSGLIPGATGSTSAAFAVSPYWWTMYTTHVEISYLSCENGHLVHKHAIASVDYFKSSFFGKFEPGGYR
jgi:hypothetical protein